MWLKKLFILFKTKLLKPFIVVTIACKVIGFDQFTKEAALEIFHHSWHVYTINQFLDFVLVYNRGISFGILGDFSYSNHIFIIINIVVCIILLVWLCMHPLYSNCFAIGFVIGGAIGNLIDRFRFNAVVDFIDFHIGHWHYPAFNFADSAIVIGVSLLIAMPLLNNYSSSGKEAAGSK